MLYIIRNHFIIRGEGARASDIKQKIELNNSIKNTHTLNSEFSSFSVLLFFRNERKKYQLVSSSLYKQTVVDPNNYNFLAIIYFL